MSQKRCEAESGRRPGPSQPAPGTLTQGCPSGGGYNVVITNNVPLQTEEWVPGGRLTGDLAWPWQRIHLG